MSAFLGSSRTSRCLLVPHDMGCRAQSAMGWRKLSPEHLLRVAQSRIGLAAGRRKRFEFSRAVLAISAEEARVRREGERMFHLLISLIGAIVPICVEIDQSVQSTAPATICSSLRLHGDAHHVASMRLPGPKDLIRRS